MAAPGEKLDKGAVDGFDRKLGIATDEDFEKFITQCDETGNGWVEQYHTETMALWKKSTEGTSVQVIKVRAYFNDVEPEVLYDVLHDHHFRKSWDDHMIEGSIVEQIDGFNEVGYYSAKMPMPLAARDFCNHRAWRVFPDRKLWIIFNHSVIHPGCPEKSGTVRGWSYLSGYMLRKTDKPGTEVTYYTQSDPKGYIPTWLLNWVSGKLTPSVLETVHKNALKYPEWKKTNQPEWRPWLAGFNPAEEPYCRHKP